MSTIDWKNFNNGSSNKADIKYLRVKGGETYRVRPIGRAIEITKVFNKAHGKTRVVLIDHRTDEGNAMISKVKTDWGITPTRKYVYAIFDRKDGNEIKFYEGPKTVFEVFGVWSQENEDEEPGGKKGADFNITVKGEGKERSYVTFPKDITPFTEDELEKIKEFVAKDKPYDVMRHYVPTELDKIEDILFGETNSSVKAETGVAAAVTSASSNSEDAHSYDDSGDDLDW